MFVKRIEFDNFKYALKQIEVDFEVGVLLCQKNEITIRSSAAEYLTFIAAFGYSSESMEMRYEDENIWQMF